MLETQRCDVRAPALCRTNALINPHSLQFNCPLLVQTTEGKNTAQFQRYLGDIFFRLYFSRLQTKERTWVGFKWEGISCVKNGSSISSAPIISGNPYSFMNCVGFSFDVSVRAVGLTDWTP